MYIKMSDFFMGMGKQFTIEVLDIAEKLFQNDGEVLFCEGDPAKHFFVLLKGRVKLSLGEKGPVVYMVRQPGEIIGWSGLIGRDCYSASGECMEKTNLLRVVVNVILKNFVFNKTQHAASVKLPHFPIRNRGKKC